MTRKSHHRPNSTGDGGALYCRDNRLVQLEARRPQRSARNIPAIAVRTRSGDVEFAERVVGVQCADVFEVPSSAEGSASAVENRNRGLLVGIEFKKGRGQRIPARGIHCVPSLRPIMDDRPNRSVFFDLHCHRDLL